MELPIKGQLVFGVVEIEGYICLPLPTRPKAGLFLGKYKDLEPFLLKLFK